MKIGVIGPQLEDDFAREISETLEALDSTVVRLGPVGVYAGGNDPVRARLGTLVSLANRDPRVGPLFARKLIERSRHEHLDLDLVITVQSLRPEVVKSLGVPVVLWFPDAVSNLEPLWMFSAGYKAIFFKEPLLVDRIRSMLGLPVFLLHEACFPSSQRPTPGNLIESIAVIGNLYPTRMRLLERLHKDGYPLSLYGPLPRIKSSLVDYCHSGTYLRGMQKAQVMRNSLAVLNNLHPAEIDGVNKRLFEGTASGGAVVTEFRRALPGLFELDSEVLNFATYGELREKLDFIIANRIAAKVMGDLASIRSHRDHSYAVRLQSLLATTASLL